MQEHSPTQNTHSMVGSGNKEGVVVKVIMAAAAVGEGDIN